MIEIRLTLGNSFFEKFYCQYNDEFAETLHKVFQHRIILTEKIIAYYMKCAKENNVSSLCQSYIQDLVTSKKRSVIENDLSAANIIEEMISIARNHDMKILLAEKSEIKNNPRDINLYRNKDICEKDNCILNLYSLPVVSRYVPHKDQSERYRSWLRNWLVGEKKIILRDKYLLKPEGLEKLRKEYLQLFDQEASIEIHTDEDVNVDVLQQFDLPEYISYDITVFKCHKMHERVIVLNEFQIVIGKGLSFFGKDDIYTDESFISISKITIDTERTKIKQLR